MAAAVAFAAGGVNARAADFPAAGVLVVRSVAVRTEPGPAARVLRKLSDFRADFRPRVVYALEQTARPDGSMWLRIAVPDRRNGTTGWIPADAASVRAVETRIVIERGSRRLTLYRGSKRLVRTKVAVGAKGAVTPLGHFYVTARFRPTNPFLGSFALETSAYAQVSDWPGGGIVGIHGTSRPDLLGHAVSHGCVRVSNTVAEQLRRLAPLGTTVIVERG